MADGEVIKLQNHLRLLREEYVKLQKRLAEVEKKYQIAMASSGQGEENSFVARLIKIIADLFNKELYSDIQIELEGSKSIHAHRFVLAARSEHWGVPDLSQVSTLDFTAINYNVAYAVLKWVYTDEINIETDNNFLLELLRVATKFRLEMLRQRCENGLMSYVNMKNCIRFYQTSEEMGAELLKKHCSELISNHWNDFTSEDFSSMPAPLLYKMFKTKTEYPLHTAIRAKREDVVFLYLIEYDSQLSAKLNEVDNLGDLPLDLALKSHQESVAQTLVGHHVDVNKRDNSGKCLLHKAIKRGDEFSASFLINNGCNVNLATHLDKESPLHMVACFNPEVTSAEVLQGMARIAKLLLDHGSDCNAQDAVGNTPIHCAVICKNQAVFSVLLQYGKLNLELKNADGFTPLWLALQEGEGIEGEPDEVYSENSFAAQLINNGSSPDAIEPESGDSLLHLATRASNDKAGIFLANSKAKTNHTNSKKSPTKKSGKGYRFYEFENLLLAYKDVLENGMSVNGAAKRYNVPVTTLRDRIDGRVSIGAVNPGPSPLFSKDDEQKLVNHVRYMASIGFSFSRRDLRIIATDFAYYLGHKSDPDALFSDHWVTNLLRRWPDLELGRERVLSRIQMKIAPDDIKRYYEEFKSKLLIKYLQENPSSVYFLDETKISIECDPDSFGSDDDTHPLVFQEATIISCGNAAGGVIPPFIVFRGKKVTQEFLNGALPGTSAAATTSGSSNSLIIKKYFEEHFLKHVPNNPDPDSVTLIFYNVYKSFGCQPVIEWAASNRIILFMLPPHSSRLLYTLDNYCFGLLRGVVKQEVQSFNRRNPGIIVKRTDICALVCRAYERVMTKNSLITAFQMSGIYPHDANLLEDDMVAASNGYKPKKPRPVKEVVMQQPKLNMESLRIKLTIPKTEEDASQWNGKQHGKRARNNSYEKIKGGKKTRKHRSRSQNKGDNSLDSSFEDDIEAIRGSTSQPPRKSSRKRKPRRLPSPEPGPSGINLNTESDNELGDDSDVDDADIEYHSDSSEDRPEEEKCCVCARWQPLEVRESKATVFVKWVGCDNCNHWTHMKYCTPKQVCRRGSYFCPHCEGNEVTVS